MHVVALAPKSLFEAIQSIMRGKRHKAYPVIMAAKGGRFGIADAKHHAVVAEMPCTGDWLGTAEVNGRVLLRMLSTLADKDCVLISKGDRFVVIKGGTSTVNLRRLDPLDAKKTKRQPLPHGGKVIDRPLLPTRDQYSDTWGFTARVPLPKRAYKNANRGDGRDND